MPKTEKNPNKGYDTRKLPEGDCYCMYKPFVRYNLLEKDPTYRRDPSLRGNEACGCIKVNEEKKKAHLRYLRRKNKIPKKPKVTSDSQFSSTSDIQFNSTSDQNNAPDGTSSNEMEDLYADDYVDYDMLEDDSVEQLRERMAEFEASQEVQQTAGMVYQNIATQQKTSKANKTTETWNKNKDVLRDRYLESMINGMEKPTSVNLRKLPEIIKHDVKCNEIIKKNRIRIYYQHGMYITIFVKQ